jgi:hypothetical protein
LLLLSLTSLDPQVLHLPKVTMGFTILCIIFCSVGFQYFEEKQSLLFDVLIVKPQEGSVLIDLLHQSL